ncbi:SDR family NAD(P)-dependent oxidoreductase [Rhodovulum sp. 12E13]|uniref:SDR family oxidoreductase n=1 Tax=Rhodovulum sp. 12E13 TaxID=2203891 RepID=UPI000E162686|nr:SDR family oxidoreductase [Rhodovulum sp. 12E13]RDC73823.1 SDR family NAD(P)-dependent oxidoreductase [Rhodovulum sp. 12E13]
MRIEGCGALVTGGASGLGAAVARMLAGAGARVTILDRDGAAAESLAADTGARAAAGDVTSEADVARALDRAAEGGEAPRIAVNCAGIAPPAKIVGRDGPHPLETFEQVLAVNLTGTFNVMRLAAERILALDPLEGGVRGAIVNTASVAAYEGQVGQAAYAASKGGVVSMTLPAAREFARSGLRVNAIAPGLFRTPMLAGLPEEARASLGAQVPFPARLGEPEEFAAAVRFCLESDYLNGEVIRLDGALRMQPR